MMPLSPDQVSPSFISLAKGATALTFELPEEPAFATLERLEELEARLVSPNKPWEEVKVSDYRAGSASEPDEVRVYESMSMAVASADHATDPFKRDTDDQGNWNGNGKYRRADHGTGGLVMLLAERGDAVGIVPVGRQTWNVAVSDDDRVKRQIRRSLPQRAGFLSMHGMFPGKVRNIADPTEVHAVIGLGANPNQQSLKAAEAVLNTGTELGLRVSIANHETLNVCNLETGKLETNAMGELVTARLRGSKPNMTNALAYKIMEECGLVMRSMQMELTAVLRMQPRDDDGGRHRDRKAMAIGVHYGYLLAVAAAKAVQIDYAS